MDAMGKVVALPKAGDVFCDIRGDDRTLRVSRHDDQGMVVVSLWAGKQCRASFRLPLGELPRLVEALGATWVGLDEAEPVVAEPPAALDEVMLAEPVRPVKARWWQRFAA